MKKIFFSTMFILFFVSLVAAESKWTKIEMTNFTLVGTASEKDMTKVGNNLEKFRQTLSVLLPKAKLDSSVPSIVYVFDTIDEYQSYFDRSKNQLFPSAIFISTPEANYIDLSSEKRTDDNYDVVFHEYFHYVLGKNLVRVPLWLNEGMAEYFGTFNIDESGTKVRLGIPAAKRIRELRQKEFIPLERLFATNQRSPEYAERDKVGVFYAESWALVHYFLNGNNGQKQSQFYNFIGLVHGGMAPKAAFEQAFQTDYKKVESELRDYINRPAFPVADYNLDQKVTSEKPTKISKLSEVEAKTLQGNLLRYINNKSDDAEKKLLQAIALDPNAADAYRILGDVYERQKRFPEARKNFEKALSLAPDNYLNYYYLAKYLRDDKNYDEAIKYYRQAIKLKADVPRVHATLGSLYESLGRNDEAIDAYKQTLDLNPLFAGNYFNLAKIAFKTNKKDLALSSAVSVLDTNGWVNNYSTKSVLILYFLYQKANMPDDGSRVLKLGMDNTDKNNFYYSVFRYLNGELDASQLLVLAKDTNDKTIAGGYIGLNLLVKGKAEEAKERFEWIRDNGNKDFTEYDYAVNELEKLKSSSQK